MKSIKMLKRFASVLVGLALGVSLLSAQERITVKGTVLDPEKQPVIGAAVLQAGTTNGAATDLDGNYTITVPAGATLEVSAIGYETLRVVANSTTLNITLQEESTELEETVVVGYGTQKKASLTSAISNIQAEDITSTKQTNLTSALQGKVPGLQIRQNSGAVGWFDDDISLRGYGEPLVIIDGVARQSKSIMYWGWADNTNSSAAALAELNPEDIESISVLKDASASIYGLGAQNGVILVTTKKGQIGKPSISYSNTLTYGVPTALPKEVDVATYMEMVNEQFRNHREGPQYSTELINHFRNHDPGYEEFSWYDAVYKDHTFSQVHNISLRGGNSATQYYVSGNYTNQDAIYRADTGDYNRYGLTANFTTKLTEHLSFTFQTVLNVTDQEMPPANTTQNAMYYGFLTERTIHATLDGDPNKFVDPGGEHRNPVALMTSSVAGSKKDRAITFRNNADVRYDAPFLKGLNFQASAAYDVVDRKGTELSLHFPLYDQDTGNLVTYNPDKNQYSETWQDYIKYYGRIQANYNGTFAHVHHVGATLAAEATINQNRSLNASRQFGDFFTHDIINQGDSSTAQNSGDRGSNASAGYVGRVNYDYKGKYLVEAMARYDGTYLYAPGHRWGFFPSYSLGWRISEEPFFKNILPAVNNLKFRWSDGLTGRPQGSAYAYLSGFTSGGNYVFEDAGQIPGFANHSPAQTIISWAKVRMMDFGFDFEVWRGLIGGSVDWFWRNTSGIAAASTATVPDFYGQSLPQMNLNADQNVGIDMTLYHRNHIGDFNYRIQANATFSRYRTTYQKSEETKIYSSASNYYSSHMIGRWSNARGSSTYHWLPGSPQFTSWEEINNSSIYYGGDMQLMLPGMYKLEDRNNDGTIDGNDVYYVWGEGNAPLQLGLVLSGSYKGFDFNMNFAAATLVSKQVPLAGGMGYGFFKTFYENYNDRWHPANPEADPFDPATQWVAGFWPALLPATSAYDGRQLTYGVNQPYTFVNGTFVRLKSVELGYTFTPAFLQKVHVRSLRVYFNGTNLLTFCNKLLKPYDPERNQGSYLGIAGNPLMKNFSAGINLNF